MALLIQKLDWNLCSVLFMVWCLQCVSVMFFSSFLIFVITLIQGIIVSSNQFVSCFPYVGLVLQLLVLGLVSLFLVVVTKMILLGYLVMMYFVFVWEFDTVFENTSKFFCFSYSQCKDESLFCHIVCSLEISDVFDQIIYIFDHQSQSRNVRVITVSCYFPVNYRSRRCFFIICSMKFVVSISSSVIVLF